MAIDYHLIIDINTSCDPTEFVHQILTREGLARIGVFFSGRGISASSFIESEGSKSFRLIFRLEKKMVEEASIAMIDLVARILEETSGDACLEFDAGEKVLDRDGLTNVIRINLESDFWSEQTRAALQGNLKRCTLWAPS